VKHFMLDEHGFDGNIVCTRRRIQLARDMDPEIPERASLVDRLVDSNDMFTDH